MDTLMKQIIPVVRYTGTGGKCMKRKIALLLAAAMVLSSGSDSVCF